MYCSLITFLLLIVLSGILFEINVIEEEKKFVDGAKPLLFYNYQIAHSIYFTVSIWIILLILSDDCSPMMHFIRMYEEISNFIIY